MEMLSREQGTKQWSDGSRETRYEAAAILKAKMTVVWTRAGGGEVVPSCRGFEANRTWMECALSVHTLRLSYALPWCTFLCVSPWAHSSDSSPTWQRLLAA